jgi:enamine deaminase RidA (YjgF/YER057c/UK114 family)
MQRRVVSPASIVPPRDRYAQAIAVDLGPATMVFTTGQQAWDQDGRLVGPGDMAAQTDQVFDLLEAILVEAGGSLRDVVKATCYVTEIRRWPEAAAVRNRRIGEPLAASTVVEVSGMTDPGALIEIEVTAIIPKEHQRP